MNHLLGLFLNKIDLTGIEDGGLRYDCKVNRFFTDFQYRYALGAERGEESELRLSIKIFKTGCIHCEIWTLDHGDLDSSEVFNLVNATLENIEKFVMTANIDVTKIPAEDSQSLTK